MVASISTFRSLVGISIEIMNSVVGLKICVITAETRKFKSIINANLGGGEGVILPLVGFPLITQKR